MAENNQNRQIFLGNISYDARPEDVQAALFDELGIRAARVRIATWKETGSPRGFGFVDLDSVETRSVQEVIDIINGAGIELYGRTIRADVAKAREPRQDQKGGGQRQQRPRGGRGRARDEFSRKRNEFDHRNVGDGDDGSDW